MLYQIGFRTGEILLHVNLAKLKELLDIDEQIGLIASIEPEAIISICDAA